MSTGMRSRVPATMTLKSAAMTFCRGGGACFPDDSVDTGCEPGAVDDLGAAAIVTPTPSDVTGATPPETLEPMGTDTPLDTDTRDGLVTVVVPVDPPGPEGPVLVGVPATMSLAMSCVAWVASDDGSGT